MLIVPNIPSTTTKAPSSTTSSSTTTSSTSTTPAPSTTDSTASPVTTASSTSVTEDAEFVSEQQNPAKRSVDKMKPVAATPVVSVVQQPMLLNAELIDKLMSNKTLVSLMSSQLKRVLDTERMGDGEKQRIVRQVFDRMMEERVDFSMNNVRLAVKTVSSSYRAAAEKQRQIQETKGKQEQKLARKLEASNFGQRSSFPVIDTALKLTKGSASQKAASSSRLGQKSAVGPSSAKDASGNPIVVVLLPQEKA